MTPSQSKSYEARVEEAALSWWVSGDMHSSISFKAGVDWSNANPAPHILELVAAVKNIAETGVHEKMILTYEQERDLYQEMARETIAALDSLRKWVGNG